MVVLMVVKKGDAMVAWLVAMLVVWKVVCWVDQKVSWGDWLVDGKVALRDEIMAEPKVDGKACLMAVWCCVVWYRKVKNDKEKMHVRFL